RTTRLGGESAAMLYASVFPSPAHNGSPLQYAVVNRVLVPRAVSNRQTDGRPCASRRSMAAVLPSGERAIVRKAPGGDWIAAASLPPRSTQARSAIGRYWLAR